MTGDHSAAALEYINDSTALLDHSAALQYNSTALHDHSAALQYNSTALHDLLYCI